ncbi:ABC transporter substrate-binding protein [uncultured Sutterella sp.]|mgnify:CR=1 FL=1|uniref:ABC transporter substrate-binding protein n=1 Tax=uncultured Sutterella sp. TaxID=286133 RepID=UPI0025D06351|nr:ABC transporter substrate-binding protein [uncultured Sutterella sp.]
MNPSIQTPTNARAAARTAALCAAALFAGSASAALFSFGPEPDPTEKTVTAAVADGFTTLDPYNTTDKLSRQVLKAFYEGFFRLNARMEVVPALALSADVSADGLTWRLTLREGVRFSDGTPFDAVAAKANIDHLTGDATRLGRSKMFGVIEGAEVTGPYELTLHLKEPLGALKRRMAGGILSMVCPAALASKDWNLALKPCGTGPYALKDYKPAELLHVVRREGYWAPERQKLAGIRFVPVPENHARAAMLKTGEADWTMPVPYESAAEIRAVGRLLLSDRPSTVMRFIAMNTTKAPWSDPRVREAMNLAVKQDAVIKAAYRGFARPASGVIPPGIPNALLMGRSTFDPERAKALLKEAGWPDGFETNLWCAYQDSASQKAVGVVQQQLAAVGIRAKIRILEAGERVARVHGARSEAQKNLDLYYTGWSASSDADWSLRPLYYSKSAPPVLFNTAFYSNPRVDELMDAAAEETDEAKARRLYAEVQETIRRDAPYVWCVFEDSVAGWNRSLTGFVNLPDGGFDFTDAQWRPEAK